VGVWFRGNDGASVLNTFLERYGDKYEELWDNVRAAKSAKEDTKAAADEATEALDAASGAYDLAKDNYSNALDSYNAALDALLDCLEYMDFLQESIDFLEWLYPECFDTTTGNGSTGGLGTPGQESGPQLPPTEGGDTTPWGGGSGSTPGIPGGTEYGPGSGIGSNSGPCPCDDCEDEYQALLDAQQALLDAEAWLAELEDLYADALADLDAAQKAHDEQEDIGDDEFAIVTDLQAELDGFMEKHVFSNTVGGTPAHGPNHVKYRGVDIYFSDYNDFMNIWELIKPWINEIADELEAAEEVLAAANADLNQAILDLMQAELIVDDIEAEIAIADFDIIMARLNLSMAEDAYYECIALAQLCHEAFGCGPYIPPHERDAGAAPPSGGTGGTDTGGTGTGTGTGGTEGTDTGTGTGGAPPGQGTGTGTSTDPFPGPCPCGDCLFEYNRYLEAEALELDAFDEMMEALQNLSEMYQRLDEVKAEVSEIEAQIAELEGARGTDPTAEIDVMIAALQARLATAEAALSGCETMVETAQAAYDHAMLIHELTVLNTQSAWNAYQECLRKLKECEEENDCDPSEPPEEGVSPPPWPFPPDDGDDEDSEGTDPGGVTEPSNPFPGGIPDPDCPCPDCLDELLEKLEAEKAVEDAEKAWREASDNEFRLNSRVIELEVEVFALQAEVDHAQGKVDELQAKLDSYLDQTVFVDGVGSDPAAGPNMVTYKGVTIYFSDYSMYQTVFNEVKKGIDKLAAELDAAKQKLQVPLDKLNQAQADLAAAQDAHADSEAIEEHLWNMYEVARKWYELALDAWLQCMIERADCFAQYPEECEDVPFTPEIPTEMVELKLVGPGIFDNIQSSINSAIADAESGMADSQTGIDDAKNERDGALADEAGAVEEFNDFLDEVEGWLETLNEVIESVPGSAFISDECHNPPANSICIDLGGPYIIFNEDSEDLIIEWQEANAGLIEEFVDGFGNQPDYSGTSLDESIHDYTGALDMLLNANVMFARYSSYVEKLNMMMADYVTIHDARTEE